MNSDIRNKILLGTIGGAIAVYGYFSVLIGPLKDQRKSLTLGLATATEALSANAVELRKLRTAEDVDRANLPLDLLNQRLIKTIPAAHLVTCPAALTEITQGRGVPETKFRLGGVLQFSPLLPDLLMDVWSISAPAADPLKIGEAIADLENRFPLGCISHLKLAAAPAGKGVATEISFQIVVQK